MADEELEVSEELDVEEVECDEASAELELPEEERRLSEEEEDAQGEDALLSEEQETLDELADADDDEDAEEDPGAALAAERGFDLMRPGGGFAGTQAIALRAARIGKRRGLTVTSKKRNKLSRGSDHHISQRRAFAVDLSNGSSPTPQMDRTARRLAALLGRPGFSGGVLTVSKGGFRCQLLYRTNVGGNHFNHVHFGVRRL